jgi:hypothetical protein
MAVFHKFYQIAGESFEKINKASLPCCFRKKMVPAIELNHFRPISLIHSIAKLISKVLLTRLAMAVKDLISPAQTAGVSEREMT